MAGRVTISEQDRERVNLAVQSAESLTSAEFLPVIAASSGRYERSEDVVGLWCGLATLSLAWAVYPPRGDPHDWTAAHPAWQLVALAIAMIAGFVAGGLLAGRVVILRRLVTWRRQMQEEVDQRARSVFYDHRVHHTAGSSGVLLYVSLFERMASVVVDESVLQKLGTERVQALCAEFTQRLQTDSPAGALKDTVEAIGRELAPLLPRAANDVNELPDALVVIG